MFSRWLGQGSKPQTETKTTKIITLTCPHGPKGDCMQFLALIESLSKTLTADNIETVITLVENLVKLAESMKQSVNTSSTTSPATPSTTPPAL